MPLAADTSAYFEIQRVAALVAEAAAPHAPGFDPTPRLRVELQRVLRDVPEVRIPPELRDALLTGAVLGPEAARWLPTIRRWLTDECSRTGL
ncbi:hypothetical protein DFR29_1365 [Tahibacter aquaticus]|jgi:hypothetical protein|uniref:Uncharacterized protein n=1 Tax=Tahibacter aquaticus TaxID=520092 RepID=A0A4R6YG75_9GAMM|nr:hypothetical protein [Tahibacter aquaticus]TDR35354.1 hypothetical protein DFR29_1365 [Tahibacter aquaticus]